MLQYGMQTDLSIWNSLKHKKSKFFFCLAVSHLCTFLHPDYRQVLQASCTINVFVGRSCFTTSLSHRYPEEHRTRTECVKDCQHCSTSLLGNPLLQESTSTQPGKKYDSVKNRVHCIWLATTQWPYCTVIWTKEKKAGQQKPMRVVRPCEACSINF